MKEITQEAKAARADRSPTCRLVTWSGVQPEDECRPEQGPFSGGVSFQATGSFDGANVVIEGSSDGEAWGVIKDRWGAKVRLTNQDLVTTFDVMRFVRPRISGGGEETDLTIMMVVP